MKNLIFAAVVMVGAGLVAADPNPYASYSTAMATDKSSPSAAEWHNANQAALAKATSESALAAFVEDAASARALLAQVKPAYATDPMVAAQIAAVSQYVMDAEPSWWAFWSWFGDSPREIWTAALLEAARTADDAYRAEFFLDQLRWCGFPEQAEDVCGIGRSSKEKAVREFARMVAKELDPTPRCPKGCAPSPCCMGSWPYGSWGLKLPFDTMNAGHLILARGADNKTTATLLWRWGSPFDITGENLKVERGRVTLTFGNHKPKDLPQDKGAWRLDRLILNVTGDWAVGTLQKVDGNGKPVGEAQIVSGRRNPPIGPAPDLKAAVRGTPINLLAGTIADFELMEPTKTNGWTLKDGILSNRILRDEKGKSLHKNGNLRTKRADFFDFNLKYEVRVLPECNSGVYLRGIYEIQVLDSYGKPVDMHNMAAYYGRVTPRVAAEKKAGEWQTVDVTLYKRHLTVVLNGVNIIDNVPVVGITGGAMTADEFVTGPLYFQGDHSDADFRNMVLTPLE